MIAAADRDGDSKIDFAEFVGLFVSRAPSFAQAGSAHPRALPSLLWLQAYSHPSLSRPARTASL
eukprot:4331431-Pleurochrysis_carterae.AAC.1